MARTGWVGRVATARLTSCNALFSSDWEQTTFIVLQVRRCMEVSHGFTALKEVQWGNVSFEVDCSVLKN